MTTFDDNKYQGNRGVQVELSNPTGGAALGIPPVARVNIQDNETYDPTLLDDFETYPYLWSADGETVLTNPEIAAGSPNALPGQGAYEHVLQAGPKNGRGDAVFGREFAIGQDWSDAAGLNFWYYGQNSGHAIEAKLQNSQNTNTTNPSKWKLAWSDEFSSRAGSPPDAKTWGREIGDGVAIGNPGWGNDELEYYT
ncbi:MAG: hypothetical protein M3R61_08095, partial [Chloroflexota bacterium]|nr:hypothetical protein [Chloroflexota bacterium]